MDKKFELAIIIGSVRQNRFGPVVARWFLQQVEAYGGFHASVIDLAETPLPLVLPPEPPAMATTDARPAEMASVSKTLAAADAFVIVTPEYNRSFPASLKSLIDWHYSEWRAKPIGFVSYSGGSSGGLRAVEQLRLIFAELHAVTVRDSVSFARYWKEFDEEGRLMDPDDAKETASAMLVQLGWWGDALREARTHWAYPSP
ncbi:NADPH-dependent FMN reductase [Pendulispora albinea]|uniref:NAD(P)H-dependent oxidoreductase n=1 Tax=Pendulispora albinea TaxID=2741071 RepID=A0ABZ2M6S7_9BACT